MARAIIGTERRAAYEPLYDVDPLTGRTIELFYADRVLAGSFSKRSGWFWWTCQRGDLPDRLPAGPFASSYAAYRDAFTVVHRRSPMFALERAYLIGQTLGHGAIRS